jgi:hypothetical protein
MRKGTHHSPETRRAIRMERLRKSMPPEVFAEFLAADGALKWCPACKRLLPVAEFQKNKRAWDGLYDRCRECNAAATSAWYAERSQDLEWTRRKNERQVARRAANKGEKQARDDKRYALKGLYGITIEQFGSMLAAQRRRCPICHRVFESDRDAHVDHDHDTGRVRGLLCNNCNNGLGRFKDDPSALRRAAEYLERPAAEAPVFVPARNRRRQLRAGDAVQPDVPADCDRPVVLLRLGTGESDVPAPVGEQQCLEFPAQYLSYS